MNERPVGIDELNAVLAATPFLRPHGFVVTACSSGECELRVPYDASQERPGGIISGMVIMGAADVALWLAIMTLRGLDERWVTSDMHTGFLRSGRAEDILCRATVLRIGRRSAYGVAESRGVGSGELLAHHTLRYAKVATENGE
jgi:acyl-coenzyme A thioesterase PaaI-like protein